MNASDLRPSTTAIADNEANSAPWNYIDIVDDGLSI